MWALNKAFSYPYKIICECNEYCTERVLYGKSYSYVFSYTAVEYIYLAEKNRYRNFNESKFLLVGAVILFEPLGF